MRLGGISTALCYVLEAELKVGQMRGVVLDTVELGINEWTRRQSEAFIMTKEKSLIDFPFVVGTSCCFSITSTHPLLLSLVAASLPFPADLQESIGATYERLCALQSSVVADCKKADQNIRLDPQMLGLTGLTEELHCMAPYHALMVSNPSDCPALASLSSFILAVRAAYAPRNCSVWPSMRFSKPNRPASALTQLTKAST